MQSPIQRLAVVGIVKEIYEMVAWWKDAFFGNNLLPRPRRLSDTETARGAPRIPPPPPLSLSLSLSLFLCSKSAGLSKRIASCIYTLSNHLREMCISQISLDKVSPGQSRTELETKGNPIANPAQNQGPQSQFLLRSSRSSFQKGITSPPQTTPPSKRTHNTTTLEAIPPTPLHDQWSI